MANKVVIDVEARFVDNLSGEAKSASQAVDGIGKTAQKVKPQLDKLGKTKVKPIFDADNNKLIRKLREAESKAQRLGRTKTAMVLSVIDKATNIIGKVLNKGQSLAGKVWSTYVKVRDSDALSSLKQIGNMGRSITGKTWRATVKVVDYATAPLRKLKDMLFSIQTLVGTIMAGMATKKFVLDPINLADAYSGAQIGFSTLLGDSAGQAMMDQIDEFAKATPFKTAGVISNVQKMMAYGWDVDRVIEDMETIGDAAAATGKGDQGLESIVYALSEIRSKGKLSTQELNQLASAGIKAKAYLAEGLGYGTSDEGMKKLAEDLEAGAIGANQAIDLILKGMKEFDGMMDKTANETVEGLWSQIEDTFEINVFRRWGQGLQDGAKKGFGSIVSLLDEADGALEGFGNTLYEVGKTVSNWAADKLENAVQRITKITDTFEFKNASLGEKISMLWKGVIVDPLKEWWEGGGQEKTAETAGNIGKWMGETLTSGLLAIFGATDILEDGAGENTGKSVAGSFLKGFLDGFDGSAITDAFVDAISNVWNALPWWGKMLVGGYTGAKAIGGIGSLISGVSGGISAVGGLLGSAGAAGIGSKGILGLLANTGYRLMPGYAALGVSGGWAAGAGAGALTAGAGLIHAGTSAYDAYKSYKQGDTQGVKANLARSGFTLAGIGGGALVGAKAGAAIGSVGGPVGTLVGAGLGTVVGWFAGDKIARNIEAAKFESEGMKEAIKDADKSAEDLSKEFEKAVYNNMKDHFGDMKLSMEEIERLSNQIVFGDKIGNFDKFTSATKNAEANLQSLKKASAETDRWMWKAGLGVKFNDDEKKSIKQSFDDYINSAKSLVENKHYEFTAAVSMLVDVTSKDGKSIIESGNAYYGKMQKQLDKAGKDLGDALSKALEDGIISADEQKAIAAAQKKIADITSKIANAESKAEMDLIKVKFGGGNLDLDSFDAFMSTMQETITNRMTSEDKAYKVAISNLELQLADGAISKEEYNRQKKIIEDGYAKNLEDLQVKVKNLQVDLISDTYGNELGKNAAEKINKALETALNTGVDPIEWSDEKLMEILGVDNLSGETAGAIKQMLSGAVENIEIIIKPKPKIEEDAGEEVKKKVEETLPETVEKTVGVNIKGEKNIQNTIDILAEDFGIPPEHAATVALLLTGDKELLNKIDVSQLAKEFGIPESQAKTIIEKLTGSKSIENRLEVLASDFGIPDSISKTISVNLKAIKGKITNAIGNVFGGSGTNNPRLKSMGYDGDDARGNIEYPHGYNVKGFADGGFVRGGAKLIKVAEEGSPEAIIPLGSQRRERGLKLWEKAGEMLGVNRFYRGGLTGGGDEGIRLRHYGSDEPAGGQTVQVDVGGVTVQIQVDAKGSDNIVEAIKAQGNEIAETVAGILVDAFGGQFENTPVRGGA